MTIQELYDWACEEPATGIRKHMLDLSEHIIDYYRSDEEHIQKTIENVKNRKMKEGSDTKEKRTSLGLHADIVIIDEFVMPLESEDEKCK